MSLAESAASFVGAALRVFIITTYFTDASGRIVTPKVFANASPGQRPGK